MPLGTEVGLGPGHIVLDGELAPPRKGIQQPPPDFSAHFALARSPISTTAELLFCDSWPSCSYTVFDVLQDGFYEGELMNGKRGLVPSNFIERVPGKI